MKLKKLLDKINSNKIWVALLLLLSILAFTSVYHSHLSQFLFSTIEEVTVSLGLLLEIKSMLAASSHIPIIGGSAIQAEESIQEVVKYLKWSDMIITAQLILIKISKTIIFKTILAIGLVGTLISKYRSFSLKVVVILLLINPGLPAYVSITKSISKEVKLDDASGLHEHIQQIHRKYQSKEGERKQIEEKRKQEQLEKAKSNGKDHISGLKKLEDKVLNDGSNIAAKIDEGVSEGITVISNAGKDLLIKSINYVTTVAIQFLLLPFLYLYFIFQLAKKLISASESTEFLKKIVSILFLGVLISFLSFAVTARSSDNLKHNEPKGTASAIINSNVTTSPIQGIDVSHFQGAVNWDEIKSAGISFAYAKATESTSFVDPKFTRNWLDIKQNGLTRGAYHFYMAGEDPKKQAELFIHTVGKIDAVDMPPMLDLEEGGIKEGVDLKQYKKDVFVWLNMVENALGKKPIIYTDHPFGSKYLTDTKFGEYDLWIADWEKKSEPQVPEVWKGKWTIWQRTERGKVEGAIGNVDHDLFHGDQQDMERLK